MFLCFNVVMERQDTMRLNGGILQDYAGNSQRPASLVNLAVAPSVMTKESALITCTSAEMLRHAPADGARESSPSVQYRTGSGNGDPRRNGIDRVMDGDRLRSSMPDAEGPPRRDEESPSNQDQEAGHAERDGSTREDCSIDQGKPRVIPNNRDGLGVRAS